MASKFDVLLLDKDCIVRNSLLRNSDQRRNGRTLITSVDGEKVEVSVRTWALSALVVRRPVPSIREPCPSTPRTFSPGLNYVLHGRSGWM